MKLFTNLVLVFALYGGSVVEAIPMPTFMMQVQEGFAEEFANRRHLGMGPSAKSREESLARARQLVDWLAGSNESPCHPEVTREDYASALGFSSPAEAARTLKDPTPGKRWRFTMVERAIPVKAAKRSHLWLGEIRWHYSGLSVGQYCLVDSQERVSVELGRLDVLKVRPVKQTVKIQTTVIRRHHYKKEQK